MQDQKHAQFAEFFQVQSDLNVVLEPVESHAIPANTDALDKDIPPLFRLANEVNSLEQSALRPLRMLGETASELAQYLSLQSRKIDLILSHILMQESAEHQSEKAHSFGASGFLIHRAHAFEIGQPLRCKLFLEHEAAAIYCYGEVIEVTEQANVFTHTVLINLIKEQDQELLVRASLHAQTRLLKKQHTETS